MADSARPPSPKKISGRLIDAFGPAALLAALQLEVFTAIGDDAKTADEVAAAIGVNTGRLLPVLNVLVFMDLLHRDGERFVNSEESAYYLVKGKATYFGSIHELYADLHKAVLSTADSVRADRPMAEHDFSRMSDEDLLAFFRGLHGFGVIQGRDLARRYDFTRFQRLVDVGGGSGSMAIGACEACPSLQATVLELDRVVPITRQFVAAAGLADRISAKACDITQRTAGAEFDVAVLRSFVQVLPPVLAAHAIANVGRSMRSGGELFILGYVLNDARTEPWEAAAYEIAFINLYEGGSSYTDGQYRQWLGDAGFVSVERALMANNMSLIRAVKT